MMARFRSARVDHDLYCTCTGGFQEAEMGEVRFPEISTPILEKVCEYCYYKLRYANAYAPHLFQCAPSETPTGCLNVVLDRCRLSKRIPEFKVPSEIALELLMAANYLDM